MDRQLVVKQVIKKLGNNDGQNTATVVETVLDVLTNMGYNLYEEDALKAKVIPRTDKSRLFELSFEEYLQMSEKERLAIQEKVYEENNEWIDNELNKRAAEWMIVCGGEIIDYSRDLQRYPSDERLTALGKSKNRIPFVFVRTPLIEEVSQNSGSYSEWA